MQAGQLRHQITIERRVDNVDTFGQPQPTWSTYALAYAAAEPARGQEFFAANQLEAVEPMLFRMRFVSGITQRHRVQYAGKIWDIRAIVNVFERDRELQLYCDAGLTEG